ncbi:hypothetical protein [Lacticigenium naphthae]|uniref:hypothetical protein n=1 Tax=Lacticigenium naphthae TaxID=515351 RepID=UPI0004079834|nr:hypothetical protein [Lacticigenium naphthae]
MEQLFWRVISIVNKLVLWVITSGTEILPLKEAYFWSIGMLGVFFLLGSYLLVKISRKLIFGDYLLAFIMAISFTLSIILSLTFQEIQFSVLENRLTVLGFGFIGFLLLAGLVSGLFFLFYLAFQGISRYKERHKLSGDERVEN